jgi:hypothetical protein
MALEVEGVVYRGVHAQEALGGSSRFDPLHLALSSPHRLMHRAEFRHPAPDGFVADVEPALGEQILDVSVAQREAQVEPAECWMTIGGNRWRR